nr:hypothetical protein [Bacteroidaceae bacterium]
LNIRIKADPSPATVYTNSVLSFTPTKPAGEEAVTTVKVYMGVFFTRHLRRSLLSLLTDRR